MIHSNRTEAPRKIWNIIFVSIFISSMAMSFGMQIVNTIFALYVQQIETSATIVGTVSSSFALTALILKLISGPAIDAFNRKYILTAAILVLAASYCGYSLSYSIPMLTGFRMLEGAGKAFTATCFLALASDALPSDKLGAGIGYYSLAQATCQAIGPSISLALLGLIGYRYTFIIGASIMVLAAVVALWIKDPASQRREFKITVKGIVAKEALVSSFIMFFLTISYCTINFFLVIYAHNQGVIRNVGNFFTVYAITLMFTRPVIGRLADKLGIIKVLIPSMCCFAASFVLISFSSTLPMFLLAAFVSAFGYGACQPAVQTLCMKSVTSERRGAGSSTNYIGQDLGNIVGASFAGFFAENFGFTNMWRMMIFPIMIAMLIVFFFRSRIAFAEQEFIEQKE